MPSKGSGVSYIGCVDIAFTAWGFAFAGQSGLCGVSFFAIYLCVCCCMVRCYMVDHDIAEGINYYLRDMVLILLSLNALTLSKQ